MPHWTLHDLRRTARTILSRYATPDHAERVIGHIIGGVRGVYDLYEYADEKMGGAGKAGRPRRGYRERKGSVMSAISASSGLPSRSL